MTEAPSSSQRAQGNKRLIVIFYSGSPFVGIFIMGLQLVIVIIIFAVFNDLCHIFLGMHIQMLQARPL